MNEKSLFEIVASAFSNNVPGKGITNYLYQKLQHIKTKKDIEEFSEELKSRIMNIDDLSQYELLNLGTALYAAFMAKRQYKQGWVVDGYWAVFNKCDSKNKTILTGVSGW